MSYTVALAPSIYSTTPPLILTRTAGSDVDGVSRRVSRTATLDGGAVLTDLGSTHADRTLAIAQDRATEAEVSAAQYLCRTYPTVVVATRDGCYLGALETVRVADGRLLLSILVSAQLSA